MITNVRYNIRVYYLYRLLFILLSDNERKQLTFSNLLEKWIELSLFFKIIIIYFLFMILIEINTQLCFFTIYTAQIKQNNKKDPPT